MYLKLRCRRLWDFPFMLHGMEVRIGNGALTSLGQMMTENELCGATSPLETFGRKRVINLPDNY